MEFEQIMSVVIIEINLIRIIFFFFVLAISSMDGFSVGSKRLKVELKKPRRNSQYDKKQMFNINERTVRKTSCYISTKKNKQRSVI